MSLLFNDRNIAAGGQVYDRMTGSWVGETQGAVGDGIDHGFAGYQSRVHRDANGVIGVEVYIPRGGSGPGSSGVNPGQGGSGPASPQVGNGVAGRGSGGGAGPGSALVVSGSPAYAKSKPQRGKDQGTVFADDDGPFLDVWEMAPTTPLMVGGNPLVVDRGWSDAGQAEERWGEGELASPTWFYQWGVAFADMKANATHWYLSSPLAGVSQAQREANADALANFFWNPSPALVDGKLPKQEPVDWGR